MYLYIGFTRKAYNSCLWTGVEECIMAICKDPVKSGRPKALCRIHHESLSKGLRACIGRNCRRMSRGNKGKRSSKEAKRRPPFPFPVYSVEATSLAGGCHPCQGSVYLPVCGLHVYIHWYTQNCAP